MLRAGWGLGALCVTPRDRRAGPGRRLGRAGAVQRMLWASRGEHFSIFAYILSGFTSTTFENEKEMIVHFIQHTRGRSGVVGRCALPSIQLHLQGIL